MVSFGGNVILPDDPNWPIPPSESLYILACAAVGSNAFVFSAALEGERHTLDDDYARFYRYDAGRWLCVEIDASISDLLVLRPPQAGGEGFVALERPGTVWFVGDQTRSEQLPNNQDGRFIGSVVWLRHTAGTFFTLGLKGQCYRRDGTTWVSDNEGVGSFEPPFPRKRKSDVGEVTDVSDIATLPNGDQYLCGSVATARPAIFWRSGGSGRWQWLGYAVDDPAYDYLVPGRILIEPPGTVWITTDKGVLVKGNAAQGFRIATAVALAPPGHPAAGGRAAFSNAVHYNGAIHVGSNVGTFRLRGDGGWDALVPDPSSVPDKDFIANGWLDASGGTLWAFGVSTVARYDGQFWRPVPVPGLYRDGTR